MTYRHLLTIAAVDGIVFGVGFLLVPDLIVGILGPRPDTLAQLAFRQVGAAVLGMAVVDWLGRNAEDVEARRAIVAGNLVSFVPIAITAGYAAATGVTNALGWGVAAFHAVMAVGFAWLLAARRRLAEPQLSPR